jgi:hypothetical protein
LYACSYLNEKIIYSDNPRPLLNTCGASEKEYEPPTIGTSIESEAAIIREPINKRKYVNDMDIENRSLISPNWQANDLTGNCLIKAASALKIFIDSLNEEE